MVQEFNKNGLLKLSGQVKIDRSQIFYYGKISYFNEEGWLEKTMNHDVFSKNDTSDEYHKNGIVKRKIKFENLNNHPIERIVGEENSIPDMYINCLAKVILAKRFIKQCIGK